MKQSICIEKISCIIIGLSFVFTAFVRKSGSYNVLSYVLFIGALFLIFIKISLRKIKISKKQKSIILMFLFVTFFIELISCINYGLKSEDIISMISAFLIPMFFFYNYFLKDYKREMYIYIFFFWSFAELMAIIIFIFKIGFNYNFNSVEIMRAYIPIWPNHFAMTSVIKIAIYFILNNECKNKYKINKYLILSLIVIVFSQSRTSIVMLIIVVIMNLLFNNKINIKKILLIVLFGLFILLSVSITSNNKGKMDNNSLKHTMQGRIERWNLIKVAVNDNILIGNGFRSVNNFIETTTGVEIGSSHNDYFDILLKGGIVYFIVIYGYIVLAILKTIKSKKFHYTSLIIVVMIAGITQNPLKNYIIQFIFYFTVSDVFITSETVIKNKII